MQDNLSLVITIIVLVALIVIFPLYNLFERQDNMSYNLVLKATTNFIDEVKNNGYIDNTMYDNFVKQLANTGNIYNIELEAHKKILVKDLSTADLNDYIEKYKVDYNDDIFQPLDTNANPGVSANITTDRRILKNSTYLLNKDDQIYVKVKNYNQTMAETVFKIISPGSKSNKISVNYGGVISNNSWKQVDSTYFAHNTRPTISLVANPDVSTVVLPQSGTTYRDITFTATATVSSWWKHIEQYVFVIKNASAAERTVTNTTGILTERFNEGGSYVKVYAIDSDGEVSETKAKVFIVMDNFGSRSITGVTSEMKSVIVDGATISSYTYRTRNVSHANVDSWKIEGLLADGVTKEIVNPGQTNIGDSINVSGTVTPNRYIQLIFTYYTIPSHVSCLTAAIIEFTVDYKFE